MIIIIIVHNEILHLYSLHEFAFVHDHIPTKFACILYAISFYYPDQNKSVMICNALDLNDIYLYT